MNDGKRPKPRPRNRVSSPKYVITTEVDRDTNDWLFSPQVSDDNPLSEAQFKTLKYHPGFPGRFHNMTAAIAFCRTFFPWCNTEQPHGGITMLTPDDVHHPRTQSVLRKRGRTVQTAWARHPECFVRGVPKPDPLPEAVWINPPVTSTTGETAK